MVYYDGLFRGVVLTLSKYKIFPLQMHVCSRSTGFIISVRIALSCPGPHTHTRRMLFSHFTSLRKSSHPGWQFAAIMADIRARWCLEMWFVRHLDVLRRSCDKQTKKQKQYLSGKDWYTLHIYFTPHTHIHERAPLTPTMHTTHL